MATAALSRLRRRVNLSDAIITRISGIPCEVRVTHFFHQPPMGPSADSDWDCYGYTEIEFDVYDSTGYPAMWLEKKMTDDDIDRIKREIEVAHGVA
jgi:hypothetical protein